MWPEAPRADGGTADLRKSFVQRGSGYVAAGRHSPEREVGFVAASDTERRLTMGYLFPVSVFPWLTLWEENCARTEMPWNGAVHARGLEFGTTPFPIGKEAADASGPILGLPTALRMEGHATQDAPWMLFAVETPQGCDDVRDVTLGADEIILHFQTGIVRLPAAGAAAFLRRSQDRKKEESQ